jgi:SAM-dependent methyltransferase
MSTDLSDYRRSLPEQTRISDLFRLAPNKGRVALDIGARDGYLSKGLADRFNPTIALDLRRPNIKHPNVECVQADAGKLPFADDTFDLVLCAEVLEHIRGALLPAVCREIARVANGTVVIGVPYMQDIRVGRTTCATCSTINPLWGHVNSFSQDSLVRLFDLLELEEVSFVGESKEVTNVVSVALLDFAGNPYGTYSQDENCVSCGARLKSPELSRTILQRLATRGAVTLNQIQQFCTRPHANWIHLRFSKKKVAVR